MRNCCSVAGLLVAIWLLQTAPGSSLFFQPDLTRHEADTRPTAHRGRDRRALDQHAESKRPKQSVNHPYGSIYGTQSTNLGSKSAYSRPEDSLKCMPQPPPLYRYHYCSADEENCRPPVTQSLLEKGTRVDRACKWQLAFKAVRGNERVVSMDFFVPGGINEGIEAAKTATSDLVYRDSSILDRWEHLLIQQVKIEVYSEGEIQVWFVFDGLGSNKESWMSQRRLIASSYNTPLKTNTDVSFDVLDCIGLLRSFSVSYPDCPCDSDCVVLAVNEDITDSSPCPWEADFSSPFFIYKEPGDPETLFEEDGETRCGDRLLISTKICDADRWID